MRASVRFGGWVAIERDDGRTQTWRIVGEDEADPAERLRQPCLAPGPRRHGPPRRETKCIVAGQAAEITAVG